MYQQAAGGGEGIWTPDLHGHTANAHCTPVEKSTELPRQATVTVIGTKLLE